MHDDQVEVDVDDLRRLLRAQQPQWADLPIELLTTSGTDNAMFRLGTDHVVRMPIIGWAADQVELESAWLPRLAPHLPLVTHEPVFVGAPGAGYPWPWLVCRWIDGENLHHDRIDDQQQLAHDLAGFARAMWSLDLPDAPRSPRGRPLRHQDETITDAIERLRPELGDDDADLLRSLWAQAIAAPSWSGGFHPIHGDLSGNNLLVRDGRLHAIIDWSCFGIGEPAVDIEVAWELFDADTRAMFFDELGIDDDTRTRSIGWAIRAIYGIPYYRETNPGIVERAWRRIRNVLAAARP